jgi:hypothetical protein
MPLNYWRVSLWYGGEICSHLALMHMVLSLGLSLSINLRGDFILFFHEDPSWEVSLRQEYCGWIWDWVKSNCVLCSSCSAQWVWESKDLLMGAEIFYSMSPRCFLCWLFFVLLLRRLWEMRFRIIILACLEETVLRTKRVILETSLRWWICIIIIIHMVVILLSLVLLDVDLLNSQLLLSR